MTSARASNVSNRLRCRPSKFSSTSASWAATASESSARTRSTIWLARVLSVGLRSRGSVAGLNGRTITRAGSGRRKNACRFRKVACDTVSSVFRAGGGILGAHGTQCRRFRQAGVDARKLTNLRESKQIAHNRLAAAIFVGAIGGQSIGETAGARIDQRHGQIVAAQEPCESAVGDGFPLGIVI